MCFLIGAAFLIAAEGRGGDEREVNDLGRPVLARGEEGARPAVVDD